MLKNEANSKASMVRSRALFCALDEAETEDSSRSTTSETNAVVVDMYAAATEAKSRIDSGEDPRTVFAWLLASWVGAITRNASSAFRKGASLRASQVPGRDSDLLDGYPRLKKSIVDQSRYLSGFAEDVLDGAPDRKGRMSFVNRSVLYGKSMKGYYNLGAMAAGGSRDVVFWNLGACEHCSDCVALSASGPYFSDEMPTVPGMGHTKCGHNCCCSLSIRPGVGRLLAAPQLALGPLAAAGSLRAPTRMEALSISDDRLREAFIARSIQESDSSDVSGLMSDRDRIRDEIDDQVSRLRVNFPELLPLGGPISMLISSNEDFEEEFDDRSIDGSSLMRLKEDQMESALEELLGVINEL